MIDKVPSQSPGATPQTAHIALSRTVLGLQRTSVSRNTWRVAILTFGEGWHNNHHAHPNSVRHGLAWYEMDVTWMQIRFLQLIGVASKVKVATVDMKSSLARKVA